MLLEPRVRGLELRDQAPVLLREQPALQPALDRLGGFPEIERLRDVVVGALAERVDRGRRRSVAGDENDARILVSRLGGPDHLQAVDPGQVDVGQDEVEFPRRDLEDGVIAVVARLDLVPLLGQEILEDVDDLDLVVHDQDSGPRGFSRCRRRLCLVCLLRHGCGVIPQLTTVSFRSSTAATDAAPFVPARTPADARRLAGSSTTPSTG